jgi:hypothetical protein
MISPADFAAVTGPADERAGQPSGAVPGRTSKGGLPVRVDAQQPEVRG